MKLKRNEVDGKDTRIMRNCARHKYCVLVVEKCAVQMLETMRHRCFSNPKDMLFLVQEICSPIHGNFSILFPVFLLRFSSPPASPVRHDIIKKLFFSQFNRDYYPICSGTLARQLLFHIHLIAEGFFSH